MIAEEQRTGQSFEPRDLLADRTLRQMQRVTGRGHAAVVGDRDECAEQSDVEITCHSCIMNTNGSHQKNSLF